MAACVHKREFVLWKYFSNRDMSLYLIKIWMVASCVQTHADGKHNNNNNNSKKKKYFINPPFFVCLFVLETTSALLVPCAQRIF